MKLARKIALPFIAGSKKKKLWYMKDVLILDKCIVCETFRTFLGLMLHLIDIWFFIWWFLGLFGFFWLEKGSAKKLLSGTPMTVLLLNR